jgi:hypothetical protein
MNLFSVKSASVAVLAVVGAVGSANAALVTITGTNFDLTYDTTKLGAFGAPTLVGNSVFFTPASFSATASGPSGFDMMDDTVTGLILTAKTGFQFGSFDLVETGAYTLIGNAANQVGVSAELKAFNTSMANTTQTSDFLTVNTPLNTFVPSLASQPTAWQGTARIDSTTAPIFGSTNVILTNPTQVGLTIQNTLIAFTSGSGLQYANINKTFSGLELVVTPVPEASTTAMLAAGLGVLLLVGSRRRRLQD